MSIFQTDKTAINVASSYGLDILCRVLDVIVSFTNMI